MDSFSYPDTYDKAYLADAYTSQPDYTFDSFFDQPMSSIELSSGFPSKDQSAFNPSLQSSTKQWPSASNANDITPFGNLNQFPSNSFFDPSNTTPFEQASFNASRRNSSPTPSLCGDAPTLQQQQALQINPASVPATSTSQSNQASPSLSPQSLKRESPSSPPFIPASEPKRPQRKRGRPRLDRQYSDSSASTNNVNGNCISKGNANMRPTHRLPHNQVERKYREGLNSELERLRRAVPTLPQGAEDGSSTAQQVLGQPKPSKAMVLSGAIEYIKRLERERDEALRECEVLRQNAVANSSNGGWDAEWDRRSGFEDQFIASDVY
ncbi:hypothetical protein BU24DRAFT_459963 [Aaosphaeria arxii CBS 175.79]|uniref:BHLH domain-containing protein n=1 Tax=Aaosphaeria arxii CBS 175.79 TaxID=1450172 RepID=A0A6A5XV80_9PLEO|nr:uncharacterized protein BU24DRAFT_459963 [Aaosphaeria arxii CBS 175.79]KAF2016843.1 hypothetical protein BU24DRAFT_459963 [Aaosphaeria arxii CBS 175.79]